MMQKLSKSQWLSFVIVWIIVVFVITPAYAQTTEPSEIEQVVLLTNLARAGEGRPPLAFNETLAVAAQDHAEAMAAFDFFSHDDPRTFTAPYDRIIAAGYNGNGTGENIAAGQTSAADVVADWLTSPGHRANIMHDSFREIGVGYLLEDGDVYPTAESAYHHYWVQTFGVQEDVFPIVINLEAPITDARDVQLYIYGEGWAQEMRFRNEDGVFSSWEPFQSERTWRLTEGDGFRRVTVELRREDEVRSAEDTITLTNTPLITTDALIEALTGSHVAASTNNEFIQVGVRDDGRFMISTTGGDPATDTDDERFLLFGDFGNIRTSFTTVRIDNQDIALFESLPLTNPSVRGNTVETNWLIDEVQIDQRLTLAKNPYTNRADTVAIQYQLTNNSDAERSVGVRLMLDVKIGENDGAPYFVSNSGALTTEVSFEGEALPVYWRAFEDPAISADSLQAQGLLNGGIATPPDRFVIARWPDVVDTLWDYSVTDGSPVVGDSATALYWLPQTLAPGETRTVITYYGLAGVGGGQIWLDAPVAPTCENLTFPVTLWINNQSSADFIDGFAVLDLPEELSFAEGNSAEQSLGNIPIGSANAINWQLIADGSTSESINFTANVLFSSGSETVTTTASINGATCVAAAPPTSTPTPTLQPTTTPTPSPTKTATPPPTFTPIPPPTPIVSTLTEGLPTLSPAWWVCFPWWALIPLFLLLLFFLILALTPLGNWLRDRLKRKSWLCKLLAFLTSLYLLLLAALFARELFATTCQIDQVYFWRITETDRGIYTTDFGVGGEPTPFVELNETGNCVGCHAVENSQGQIAAVGDNARSELILMTLLGDMITTPADIQTSYSTWSPDGEYLALSLHDKDIYILEVDSGILTPLDGASEPGDIETMPAWSPDGQAIAFVRATNSNTDGFKLNVPSDIYVVPASGGTAAPLAGASGSGFNYYPTYSPDGNWIAFTRHTQGTTSYADDAADIYLVPSTGGEALPLAANVAGSADSWPSWSRDSQWLAFSSNRADAQYDIYVAQIDEMGASTLAVPLPGADAAGVFEHLPRWGTPEPILPLLDRLLALLPWLIPLLILLLLGWLTCRERVPPPVRPLSPPQPPTRNVLPPPGFLDKWEPGRIWEPLPTLILGVGGTGRRVLTQIKKNLLDAGQGQRRDDVRLLLLDTGSYELREGQTSPVTFAGVSLDPENEVVEFNDNIGHLRDSDTISAEFANWFPQTTYQRTAGGDALDLKLGSQGRRPPVRAALVNDIKRGTTQSTESSRFWQQLYTATHAVLNQGRVRVVIVGSLAGGTGSALISDAAYLARRAAEAIKAESSTIEAFVVSDAAFARHLANPELAAANTFATLRELERFQMAQSRPFRMSYNAKKIGDPILNNLIKSRLLDDIYLMDGHRADRPLGNELPELGVFASIADIITLLLDKASRGNQLGERRRNIRQTTEGEQRKLHRMIVGSAGSFTYRLPMYDIVQRLKVRYAREIIQLLLMGNIEGEPRLDVAFNQEHTLGTALSLATKFMTNQAGLVGCTPVIKQLGLIATTGWDTTFGEDEREISAETAKTQFQTYLANALALILNGQHNSGRLTARSGKIAYASEFLQHVSKLFTDAQNELRHVDEPKANQLQRAISMLQTVTIGARELLAEQAGLLSVRLRPAPQQGWRDADGETAVYEWLLKREREQTKWKEQMDSLLVRTYIHDDALVDGWYKQYLDDASERAKVVERFHWQTDDEGVMRLYLRTDRDIALRGDTITLFSEALLNVADHQLQKLWKQERLHTVLDATVLHPEKLTESAETLWQNSGALVRHRAELARRAMETGVLGINHDASSAAAPLQTILESHMAAQRQVVALDTTDQFSLILMRTMDVLPLPSLPLLAESEQYYRLSTEEPTAIFAAEQTAQQIEQRMGPELQQQARVLHPTVVTGLNEPDQAYLFALAYSAGWIEEIDKTIRLHVPETNPVTIVNHTGDPLHSAVLAFVHFATLDHERAIAGLRYAIEEAEMSVEDRWRRWTRPDWMENCPELWQESQAARDLAIVIALYTRDEVRSRVAKRNR